eukprot:scaffold2.g7446.t1
MRHQLAKTRLAAWASLIIAAAGVHAAGDGSTPGPASSTLVLLWASAATGAAVALAVSTLAAPSSSGAASWWCRLWPGRQQRASEPRTEQLQLAEEQEQAQEQWGHDEDDQAELPCTCASDDCLVCCGQVGALKLLRRRSGKHGSGGSSNALAMDQGSGGSDGLPHTPSSALGVSRYARADSTQPPGSEATLPGGGSKQGSGRSAASAASVKERSMLESFLRSLRWVGRGAGANDVQAGGSDRVGETSSGEHFGSSLPAGSPLSHAVDSGGSSDSGGTTDVSKLPEGFITVDFSELELAKLIGTGSFGEVWLAKWYQTTVAVKVLSAPRSALTSSMQAILQLDNLCKEVSVMAKLRHPNCCQYLGACLDPPCVIMVADFNLSRSIEAGVAVSTLCVTNPRWLAPCILAGGHGGLAADVWAFGTVLWELMTWELPFDKLNPFQIINQVQHSEGSCLAIPPNHELPAGPFEGYADYVALMRACWARDPADRPSMAEVASRLRTMLAEELNSRQASRTLDRSLAAPARAGSAASSGLLQSPPPQHGTVAGVLLSSGPQRSGSCLPSPFSQLGGGGGGAASAASPTPATPSLGPAAFASSAGASDASSMLWGYGGRSSQRPSLDEQVLFVTGKEALAQQCLQRVHEHEASEEWPPLGAGGGGGGGGSESSAPARRPTATEELEAAGRVTVAHAGDSQLNSCSPFYPFVNHEGYFMRMRHLLDE